MPDVDLLAVLVASVAAFVAAGTYYALFGQRLADVSDAAAADQSMAPWKLAVELLRCLIVAAVVAGLAARGGIDDWTGGVWLALALWIGLGATRPRMSRRRAGFVRGPA